MKNIVTLFVALMFAVAGCIQTKIPSENGIPKPVLDKYEETKIEYTNSLGTQLVTCKKDSDSVYVVSGSGGYSGTSYYYDTLGNFIGKGWYDDTGQGSTPINLAGYDCKQIKDSKKEQTEDFPVLEGLGRPLENNYYICKHQTDSKRIYESRFCGKDTCWSKFYDENGQLIEETKEYGIGVGTNNTSQTKVTDCKRTTEEYFKSKVNNSIENNAVNLTIVEQYQKFSDAGCVSDPLTDTNSINCENTSFVKQFNCQEPMWMQTRVEGSELTPPLMLLTCNVEGERPYVAHPIESYFGCDGGFLYRCITYVAANESGFMHIKRPSDLAQIIGPIETKEEARAFTLLSVIHSDAKLVFENESIIFTSNVTRTQEGFRVTIYQSGSIFGCYDHTDYEKVTYELTKEGRLTEKERTLAYTEKLGYTICAD